MPGIFVDVYFWICSFTDVCTNTLYVLPMIIKHPYDKELYCILSIKQLPDQSMGLKDHADSALMNTNVTSLTFTILVH